MGTGCTLNAIKKESRSNVYLELGRPVRTYSTFIYRASKYMAVATLLFFNACENNASRAASTFTIDTLASGIILVNNGREGVWSAYPDARWRVVEALRIGRVQGTGPDVFGRVGSVLVDGLNRIWVVDKLANQLKVFDSEGQFVRTVGHQGRGPGEFMRIGNAFHGPNDKIWVNDLSRGHWEIFDTTGARVGGIRDPTPMRGGGRDFWTRDNRLLVFGIRPGVTEVRSLFIAAFERSSSGALLALDTFPMLEQPPRPPIVTFESPSGYKIHQPIPFTPVPALALGPAGTWWMAIPGATERYELRRISLEGDTLLIIGREFEPVPIPDPARQASLDSIRPYPNMRPLEDIGLGDIPSAYPPFNGLFVSTAGTLWVRRVLGDGSIGFDVFSKDGRFLGHPEVPASLGTMQIRLITARQIYAVATDGVGVNYVVKLAIQGTESMNVADGTEVVED